MAGSENERMPVNEETSATLYEALDSATNSTDESNAGWCKRVTTILSDTYTQNSLLCNLVAAVSSAYIYPPLGGIYVYPEITSHWLAVILIFFVSGFSIRVDEITGAANNIRFNAFVQSYNLFFISVVQRLVCWILLKTNAMEQSLVMGMIICSCLPMPINMALILTVSSKGDEATAIINSTLGNLLGVFISPLLVLLYLGHSTSIEIADIYLKIFLRVILPLIVGIVVRSTVPGADMIALQRKHFFQTLREIAMIFIVYCLFSDTFLNPPSIQTRDLFEMAVIEFLLLIIFKTIAWTLLRLLFPGNCTLRVTGIFCCTQKTVALGIPLINAMFEDSPYLGIYSIPLISWYVSQFLIGSFLAPRLRKFVENEGDKQMC